jgi:hypothetical protein
MDGKSKEVPGVEISQLRTEIDAARDQLGTYISELDRRRHEALDLKLQVKKHPGLSSELRPRSAEPQPWRS